MKKTLKDKKIKNIRKLFCTVAVLLTLPVFLCINAECKTEYTENGNLTENSETSKISEMPEIPEEYFEMSENLPKEVKDNLPQEIFSQDSESVGKSLAKAISPKYLFEFVKNLLGEGMAESLKFCAKLLTLLLMSAIFNCFKKSSPSKALQKAVTLCTSAAIMSITLDIILKQILSVKEYFERLNSIMAAMIPVTGAVYAMGGNVGTASAGGGTMYVFLAVSHFLCAKTVVPVCCICLGLATVKGISPQLNIQGISKAIKKIYTFTLTFVMTVLVSLLASQTYLASAEDSTAARAAKLMASSVIPVVGGSVSETLRAVASGVQYIKSIVGVSGILFIGVLLLPTLVNLLLKRLVFVTCSGVAELLGCEDENKLLEEMGSIYGCMIATSSMSAVMFIISISIFMKTTVAIM